MNRVLHVAFATLTLLAVPQFASAGPIPWGYRAESPDGTVLTNVTGLTDTFWVDFFWPDVILHGTPIPDSTPDNGTQLNIKRVEATVTLTDELSGESAAFSLYYQYWEEYEINPDGSLDPLGSGYSSGFTGFPDAPWEGVPIELGGNMYKVRTLGGDFSVRVEPGQTAVTPEPGTLALAGIGLGMMFVRRWRKCHVQKHHREVC